MNDHIPDPTKMISDTPKTDENEFDWVTASFARKLERELNAANRRISRLVQAGDCLLSHRNSTDYHEKVREWDKAKKDKLNNEHLKLREEYISEIERENERLKEQNKRQNEAIDSLREMYAKEAKP